MPVFDFLKRARRDELRQQPFPPAWLEILSRNVPLYGRLTPDQQEAVRGDTQVLLAEKHFEGCGGLRIDDEIRVTIAAHAALLMLGQEPAYYPGLDSILVYPSTFLAPRVGVHGAVVDETKRAPMLGESWRQGALVLAWDAALKGARNVADGENVILHEFAHQLDTEDGVADGAPYLDGRSQYAAWARAFRPEFQRLQTNPKDEVLSAYAATNPAEFFAVATEAFFERPHQLAQRHPELYAELSTFYGLDLAGSPSSGS